MKTIRVPLPASSQAVIQFLHGGAGWFKVYVKAFLLGSLSSPLSLFSWARSNQAPLPPSRVGMQLQKVLGFCANSLLHSSSGSCRKCRRPDPGRGTTQWQPVSSPYAHCTCSPNQGLPVPRVAHSAALWPIKKAKLARAWVTFGVE